MSALSVSIFFLWHYMCWDCHLLFCSFGWNEVYNGCTNMIINFVILFLLLNLGENCYSKFICYFENASCASCMSLQCDISSLYNVLQILPEKYSYHRRPDQDTNHATDCVICMTGIDLTLRSDDCMVQWWDVLFFLYFIIDSLTSAWRSLLFSLQVTPCDHFFHSGCLQRWMDIKMECPTCRRPLPPAWIVYITYRINWHHPTH